MKNLPPISELKERIRRQGEMTAWLRADVESYLTAEVVQEGLGTWPKKLSKTDVEFDPDEERTYGNIPGGKLSGLAARIVLTANDEWGFLKVLRGVAGAMIAPLVAYLRVNLAMTRLEETIDNTPRSEPVFAPKHKAGMTDKKKKPPAFKWSQSPLAAYGFAEARATYGFDPRDTSVYWIEKRAARLRRKWARYGKESLPLEPSFESRDYVPPQDEGSGVLPEGDERPAFPTPHVEGHDSEIQSPGLEPSFESPGCARPQNEERGRLPGAEGASCEFPDEPEIPDIPIRHFVPADADYNTVWPPMELPDGPPEPLRSTDQSIDGAHDLQTGEPAVMREASPLDATLLDGDEVAAISYPHAEERQGRPSKQGKEKLPLQPSFESPGYARPRYEEVGVIPKNENPAPLSTPSAFYTNRKARRAEAVKQRRGRTRAPP